MQSIEYKRNYLFSANTSRCNLNIDTNSRKKVYL